MSKKPIEDVLIIAARGEPIDLEERSRLDAALGASAPLRAAHDTQRRLNADLAHLRAMLRELPEPADREDELRAAFRAQRRQRTSPGRARRYAARLIAVAGLAVAAAALLRFPAPPAERDAPDVPTNAAPRAAAPAAPAAREARDTPPVPRRATEPLAGAFQPLLYAPGFSPTASYSVVRVRIPVSAIAISFGTDLDGTVEADILIGEDGLPTAIRFDRTDAVASALSSQ